MTRNFRELIERQWGDRHFVCVGLDTEVEKIPTSFDPDLHPGHRVVRFNRIIVDATHNIACAYKPNVAFYEGLGQHGWQALDETIRYIRSRAPAVPIILDAKRADIGNTNVGYAKAAFDHLGADALTVHPYLGMEALKPFLDRADKEIFVLCRTSNPGAGEFQDLQVGNMPLYQAVAHNVSGPWNAQKNCGLVVGATYPEELKIVRSIVGDDMPILIPGIGAQGGDVEKTVKAGKNSRGAGMIINSSRGIIFASDPGAEARKLNDQIRSYL